MRVISQSRNFSFDFDQTVFWRQSDVIYAKIGGESIAIGKYKSDERAAEVFEDMHNAYTPYKLTYKNVCAQQILPHSGLNNFMVPQIEKGSIDCAPICDSVVYYMPEE